MEHDVDSDYVEQDDSSTCKGNAKTWDGGYGGCWAYSPKRRSSSYAYCASDKDKTTGYTAVETCPECGVCSTRAYTTLGTCFHCRIPRCFVFVRSAVGVTATPSLRAVGPTTSISSVPCFSVALACGTIILFHIV